MANLECNLCNYKSDDKSNYNRHMSSNRHKKKVKLYAIIIENDQEPEPDVGSVDEIDLNKKEYKCPDCGYIFAFISSLKKHLKGRCKKNTIVKELQKKVDSLEKALYSQQIESLEKRLNDKDKQINELTKYIQNTKPTNKTYNISVQNYIQQNYPDAPPLIKINTYKLLKEREEREDNELDFGQILAHYYNTKQLYSYLGDFLVSQYKKEDPFRQSIWNTDVARLTYFIKDLLANKKKSCWNRDPKGLKTKNYIIDPFLKYITDYCDAYIDAHALARNKLKDVEFCYKTAETLTALGNIMSDICKGIIAEDILKYIAPYFQMDNKQKNINFIDDVV
jgi:hypothetical protein